MHDAILTVGYVDDVNRLVLATGVAVEPDFEQACRPPIDLDPPDQGTMR